MPLDKQRLVTKVGNDVDWSLAYAFGVLANLSYYTDLNYDDAWAAQFGFSDARTIVTPGPLLPNYTRVRSNGVCVFGIAGTINRLQMVDNVVYSGQVRDVTNFGGYVHSYFAWCALGLAPFIEADLAGQPPGTKIAFTGHSLGGAAAHLLSWYFSLRGRHVQNCVVFNCPRVGDQNFAELSRPFGYWHVRNEYDKVSLLPPGLTTRWDGTATTYRRVWLWQEAEPVHTITVPESLRFTDSPNVPVTRAAGLAALSHLVPDPEAFRFPGFVQDSPHLNRWGGTYIRLAASLIPLTLLRNIEGNNHSMSRLLSRMKELIDEGTPSFDVGGVSDLADHLAEHPIDLDNPPPYPRDFGLQDPIVFASPVPPTSPATPTPTLPPGTTLETIIPEGQLVRTNNENTGTVRVVISAAPVPSPTNPTLFYTPPPNYEFKGKDRRLLEKLRDVLAALAGRDAKANDPAETAALSTRELVFDFTDDDVFQAFMTIYTRLEFLLGLVRVA